MRERSSRLLRLGFVRNARASTHLTMFVVAGVATVLLTRAILSLAGWPQIGGGGLHIAHLLHGGALMLVAFFLLLSYVGPVVRPLAAVIAGVGFGLFIDEVGKFVTADHDYFYRPAAAIMYAVFAAFVVAVHALHGRQLDRREQLANAVDHAVEGIAGGLSERRRVLALDHVDAGGDSAGHDEVRRLVAACPHDRSELPAVGDRLRELGGRAFRQVSDRPWAVSVVVAVLAVQLVLVPGNQVLDRLGGEGSWTDVPFAGVMAGSVAAAALVALGLVRLRRRHRVGGLRSLQLAVLVFLLVVRVFTVAHSQFGAVAGVLVDLALLGVISAELDRRRRQG